MISIRYESKGKQRSLVRMAVRADLSELRLADQRVIMFRLGQLMIDEIRALWSSGTRLDGTPASWEPPRGLRAAEAAVLERRAQRRASRALVRSTGGPKAKKALQGPKPLKEDKPPKPKTDAAIRRAEKQRAAREFAAATIKNYKLRSPRLTRTAIHGTALPRSRDYVPDPKGPALCGSGLMRDSIYAVWSPHRTYTHPQTGRQEIINSGFQFVVQKNRHVASYRAGLTVSGIQYVMSRVGAVDLNMLCRHYVAWDGSLLYELFRAAATTAAHVAGLVSGTAGFLV